MSSMAEENATVDVKPEVFSLHPIFWCFGGIWDVVSGKLRRLNLKSPPLPCPINMYPKEKEKEMEGKGTVAKHASQCVLRCSMARIVFFVGSHKTSEVFVWLFLILAERLYCNRECAPVLIFGTRRVECWKVLKPRSSGVRNLTSMWTLLLKFWYMADFGSVFHYTSWWIAFVPVTKSGLFSVCRLQSHKGYLQLRRLNFPSLQYQNAI